MNESTLAALPPKQEYGDFRAVPHWGADGTLFWDLRNASGVMYGTLNNVNQYEANRAIIALYNAFKDGDAHARREIRNALGITER